MGGETDRIKGRTKQTVGAATHDRDLQSEGEGQELKGKVKDKAENTFDKVEDFVKDTKEKISNK